MLQITTETLDGITYYTFAGRGKIVYTVNYYQNGYYWVTTESATTTTIKSLTKSEMTSKALKSFVEFLEAEAVAA